MNLAQLIGKYLRLREEFTSARRDAHDHNHVNRLAEEIRSVRGDIRRLQPQDEQTSDTLPGLFLPTQP